MHITDQVYLHVYRLLLQIHDELLFEIPTKDLQQLAGRSTITIASVMSYNQTLLDIIHTSLESHKAMLTVSNHLV